ncbi:MAG: transcriptional regulator [Terracidiphilus sp.]
MTSRLRISLDFPNLRRVLAPVIPAFLIAIVCGGLQAQTSWKAVGPAGGDVRAFGAVPGEPNHLYLGTTNSWIYESVDEGGTWRRLAKLDPAEDLVVYKILVDASNPAVVFAGGWKPDKQDGGLWVSRDAGRHWSVVESLRGQSIFSLAQAPSDAKTLFAGTLAGVFRSSDGGVTWAQVSPPGNKEIHEIESLAVDPTDPQIVYAGTWHLPWKTEDGGATWHNIKKGLIDDSDVFSIIIDPAKRRTVFLSACSGIYKSDTAGELFRKIQGIPSTARRTRVLMQDPENREVVYAGTTEGLYKTQDSGKTFQSMTGPDVIVNDVYVDPHDSNRLLLATDRGGVLASRDGGASFTASNEGISARKVEALLVDRNDPTRMYAGLVNDKSLGGVFVSTNGGGAWEQIGGGPDGGLDGRDVFALAQTKDGMVLAGTSHGLFALNTEGPAPVWQPRNTIANTLMKTASETHYGKRVNIEKQVAAPKIELASRVNALDVGGDVWLACTSYGLVTSKDQGASWQGGPVMGANEFLSVTAHGETMAAAGPSLVVLSRDAGETWMPMQIPTMLTRIHRVAFSADGTLWLGAREGVYFTHDLGKTWLWIERMPFRDVDDLYYDAPMDKVLVSSRSSDQVYAIDPKTLKWKWAQTGYAIGLIRGAGDKMIAASMFDGVLVEP